MCFGLSLKEKQSLYSLFIVYPQETSGRRCSHRENNHRMPESHDQILQTKQKENIMGGRMSLPAVDHKRRSNVQRK